MSQLDVLSYKSGLESVEARLVVYQQNENVFEEDIKLLKLDVMLKDNALVALRKKFEKAKQEIDELKQTLEKISTSLKNLNEVILQRNADHLGTLGIKKLKQELFQWRLLLSMLWCHSVMELVAMIGAFRLMKNQQIMPSWHSPPQAYQILHVLIIRMSQLDVLLYKLGLESVEARLVVYQQNENVFEEDIKLLKLDVMLKDNALVALRKKFEKAKQEIDELKQTLEKISTSLKNLSKLLESQITDKTSLGYDNQVFKSQVFHYDELSSSESDDSVPKSVSIDG
nr:hypothetical protein [Tanacetum cinerariifolium]